MMVRRNAQQFGELLKRVRYGEFNQYAYVGNYNAVYLDEIKRSDGSLESQLFGELLKRVRYGKFDQYAYVGNYNDVYLDAISRSECSVEAPQFGE